MLLMPVGSMAASTANQRSAEQIEWLVYSDPMRLGYGDTDPEPDMI